MKITTTVLAFLLISVNLLSQKAKFTWGEYEKSNFERLGAIVPIAKNEFFIKNIEVSNMGTKEVHVINLSCDYFSSLLLSFQYTSYPTTPYPSLPPSSMPPPSPSPWPPGEYTWGHSSRG